MLSKMDILRERKKRLEYITAADAVCDWYWHFECFFITQAHVIDDFRGLS